jgi:hypothetical protein
VGGVSDEANVREPYRALTRRERDILEFLLAVDADGIDQLWQQVPYATGARWKCGCASFNLIVDKANAPRSSITTAPLSEARSRDRDDLDGYYELLLWVDDGWLSGVEIVDFVHEHGVQSPEEIPPTGHWDAPRLVRSADQT